MRFAAEFRCSDQVRFGARAAEHDAPTLAGHPSSARFIPYGFPPRRTTIKCNYLFKRSKFRNPRIRSPNQWSCSPFVDTLTLCRGGIHNGEGSSIVRTGVPAPSGLTIWRSTAALRDELTHRSWVRVLYHRRSFASGLVTKAQICLRERGNTTRLASFRPVVPGVVAACLSSPGLLALCHPDHGCQ